MRLYGPVILDRKHFGYLGAEKGSNNSGEVSAICEALLWLRDFAPEGRKGVGKVLNLEGKLFCIKECGTAENIQRNRQLLLQKADGLSFVPAR